MFRIGEFSRLMQVSVRMLRYYDENGLFMPARTDPATGYRFYSAAQISDLQRILFLRDMGCTVSEISAMLRGWNSGSVSGFLARKKAEAEQAIASEEHRLRRIETAIHELSEGGGIKYDFVLKKIPARRVLSLRRIIPDYFAEEFLWKELGEFVHNEKIPLIGDSSSCNFAIYHDGEYKESDVDVEVCIPSDLPGKTGDISGDFTWRTVEAVDTMAATIVYGPFENIASAYLSFARWLSESGEYLMIAADRQICHRGPWNEENPEKYVTEIQIPVINRNK